MIKTIQTFILLALATDVTAQVIPDVKENSVYAAQKDIANNLSSKATLCPLTLPSPESMISMNESGDGVISMPIVNVQGRKLSLPINISYVTNGIKTGQKSSEVGLGWNINVGSIVRDFGAYEPDYTYNGSEFKMLRDNGSSNDKKLKTQSWHRSGTSWVVELTRYFTPINQNKILDYNNLDATKKAPDNYVVNIPGVGNNDFWNANSAVPAWGSAPGDVSFVFSDKVPWRITATPKVYTVQQELSRINEFNFAADATSLGYDQKNMAAAIGLLPYVKNQAYSNFMFLPPSTAMIYSELTPINAGPDAVIQSPNMQVKYEDYGHFIITIADGTQYVFDRPLRGQKYLFSEEPFWSSLAATPFFQPMANVPYDVVYNELWKTDYIAEWLLTYVLSKDYIDVNGNGPDDADHGDWIKIEYTADLAYANIPGSDLAVPMAKHKEYMNFTQTDRASSIWRERAYVTKITTPVEEIDFNVSERFDVDHDYFRLPFNRIDLAYKYTDKYVVNSYGTSPWYFHYPYYFEPTSMNEDSTSILYPIDMRRYDLVTVKDRSGNLVQNIKLNYAAKGAADELAVSKHLILDNNKTTFNGYHPSDLGAHLTDGEFDHAVGRGKTTLLGIDYRGTSLTSTNKLSYSFKYSFNPAFDAIHMHDIRQQAAYPTIRESLIDGDLGRWTNSRTSGGVVIPNSILPIKTIQLDPSCGTAVSPTSFTHSDMNFLSSENYGRPVMEDELGYFYNTSTGGTLNGRHAWSLTGIGLPYGGSIEIEYERDMTDVMADRQKWTFKDYALPDVGHYNNVTHMMNIVQHMFNLAWPLPASYTSSAWGNNRVKMNNEFYFLMNEYSGGLRIKKLSIRDNYGAPSVVKKYEYGAGHYTAPPADFLENYKKGFSEFMYNEFKRHGNADADGVETYAAFSSTGSEPSEFKHSLLPLNVPMRIDRAYSRYAKHYYEYIDEIANDNSKTRVLYGARIPDASGSRSSYMRSSTYGLIKNGTSVYNGNVVSVLGENIENIDSRDVTNYATEYYNNTGNIVRKMNHTFSVTDHSYNNIGINEGQLGNTGYTFFLAWHWYSTISGPIPLGLHPIHMIYPSSYTTEGLYNGLPITDLAYSPSSGSILVNPVEEAKKPLLALAVSAGIYSSGLPSWFSGISGSVAPPSTFSSQFTTTINGRLRSNDESTDTKFNTLDDKRFWTAGSSYNNQKSSSVRETNSTIINYFY